MRSVDTFHFFAWNVPYRFGSVTLDGLFPLTRAPIPCPFTATPPPFPHSPPLQRRLKGVVAGGGQQMRQIGAGAFLQRNRMWTTEPSRAGPQHQMPSVPSVPREWAMWMWSLLLQLFWDSGVNCVCSSFFCNENQPCSTWRMIL